MGSGLTFAGAGSLLFFLYSLLSAAAKDGGGAGRELWCVAKNNADDASLQSALDWCCGSGGANCAPIQKGGPCYDGSDLQRTASFAFNDYYLKNGPSDDSCNFGNTAALIDLNPSFHNCKFPSRSLGNGNFTGPTMTGSGDAADLNSSGSVTWHWAWLSLAIPIFVAVSQIL